MFEVSNYFDELKGEQYEYKILLDALHKEGYLPIEDGEQIPFSLKNVKYLSGATVTLAKLYLKTGGGLSFRFLSDKDQSDIIALITEWQTPKFDNYADFVKFFKKKFNPGNVCVVYTNSYRYRVGIIQCYRDRRVSIKLFPRAHFYVGSPNPNTTIEEFFLSDIFAREKSMGDGVQVYRAEETRQRDMIFEILDYFGEPYKK